MKPTVLHLFFVKMNRINLFIIICLNSIGCSFGQSAYDSAFVREIINSELELREKKAKKAYPIFQTAILSEPKAGKDSIYSECYLGTKIKWQEFGISSKHGFFTNNSNTDSCLYIYAPLFNERKDKFMIQFESRLNDFSHITSDYYLKKRKKWVFVGSHPYFLF